MSDYTRTEQQLPPVNVPIEWLTPGGSIVRGKFQGGAVWFPEGSAMYVYYLPPFWRRISSQAEKKAAST